MLNLLGAAEIREIAERIGVNPAKVYIGQDVTVEYDKRLVQVL